MRKAVYEGLKRNGRRKDGQKTLDIIGCDSWDQLRAHLEAQFTDGMTWENQGRGGWHIDHIQPICQFDMNDPEQRMICFWYTNLQPLWENDNLSKGGGYGHGRYR